MSSTTAITTPSDTSPPAQPKTIKLPSGQTVTPKSEIAIDSDEIPIIDVSSVWSDDLTAKKALAEQVREACHRIGFFYAEGHVKSYQSASKAAADCLLGHRSDPSRRGVPARREVLRPAYGEETRSRYGEHPG